MPSSQLRIAMLSVHSCPLGNLGARDTGGMNVYIRELARELGRQGHVVDVFTRTHDHTHHKVISLGQNARLIHLRAGDEDMNKLAMYSHLPDFACSLENFRKKNDLRYDLVFSHYWLSAWAGKYVQQWWQVPQMVMFHTMGAIKNGLGIGEDEPELRIATEKEIVQYCHHVIATTEAEKKALLQHYGAPPEKIGVIPCGVNLELFQPVDKKLARQQLGLPDDKIVLFVGRVEPLKGIDQLLRAMSYLQNGRRPKLMIIGGDKHSQEEIARLQDLSRTIKIGDSVNFLGLVKQERLPYFYSAADVCVIPSYYESFGLVALESLACGTPVVATDVGGFRSVIREGETGYVVSDNSPHHLADKIDLLLSRPDHNGHAGLFRDSIARFGWANIAEAIVRECETVLAHFARAH